MKQEELELLNKIKNDSSLYKDKNLYKNACLKKMYSVVEVLLENGADVNFNNAFLLKFAVDQKDEILIDLFIKYDIDCILDNGKAILSAINLKDYKIIEKLLKNIKNIKNDEKENILSRLIIADDIKCFELVFNFIDYKKETIIEKIKEYLDDFKKNSLNFLIGFLNRDDYEKEDLLIKRIYQKCCELEQFDIIKKLIINGYDINAFDNAAIKKAIRYHNLDFIDFAIDQNAVINEYIIDYAISSDIDGKITKKMANQECFENAINIINFEKKENINKIFIRNNAFLLDFIMKKNIKFDKNKLLNASILANKKDLLHVMFNNSEEVLNMMDKTNAPIEIKNIANNYKLKNKLLNQFNEYDEITIEKKNKI